MKGVDELSLTGRRKGISLRPDGYNWFGCTDLHQQNCIMSALRAFSNNALNVVAIIISALRASNQKFFQ